MFEWDEVRRQENFAAHGVDFVRAARMFDHPVLERVDDRQFHGERRFIAIGMAQGMVIVAVWSPRGRRRRLIEAWRGDRDDEAIYRAAFPGQARQNAGHDPYRRALEGGARKDVLADGRARLSLPQSPSRPSKTGS